MSIAETSRASFQETREDRISQERKLFLLYKSHPEGLSDRDVSRLIGLDCSQASARRNGLEKKLEDTKWKLVKTHKAKDPKTYKTVQHWTVEERYSDGTQARLI